MATASLSIERSIKKVSIKKQQPSEGEEGESSWSSSDTAKVETTLPLTPLVSLPHQWEQCLDLKTGEVCYIDWKGGIHREEDEEISFSSRESSTEWSSSSSNESSRRKLILKEEHVLAVAGCKCCLMYFMVPKLVEVCPKCSGSLIRF